MTALLAGLVAATGVLSSCGNAQDDDVARVARAFYSAVEAGKGAQACALLAPATRTELQQSSGTPCDEAILDEVETPVGRQVDVDAFGTMAQARLAGDTVFLTRFDTGWLVMAAACTRPKQPGAYECRVKGA
jgi:hypothetical protein